MSLVDFTNSICKNKNTLNKQIIDNFETLFAMYSFTANTHMQNVELLENKNAYIIRGTDEECKEIINSLSNFRCSHFANTLKPIFDTSNKGLIVHFEIDGV